MKIRPLTRQQEKLILAGVLLHLDGELPNSMKDQLKREIGVLIQSALIVVVIACAVVEPNAYKVALIAISVTAGFLLGFGVSRHSSMVQWPVVAKCIDRSLVEQRLRALDAA